MHRLARSLLPLLIASSAAAQETYTVCPAGCDYTDVQSAVDAIPASGSGTVLVFTGTYEANVLVDGRTVEIRGGRDAEVILDAAGLDALGGSLLIHRGWFEDQDTAIQIIGCQTGIRGSVFKDNLLALLNQGLQSELLIRNCSFEGNQQVLSGPATNLGGIVIVP